MPQLPLLVIQLTPEELQELIETATANAIAKSQAPPNQDEILSRKQIKEIFGVSFTTINSWCRAGRLKRRYMGSKVYFLRSEVIALLKKN